MSREDEYDLFLELQDAGIQEGRKSEIRDKIIRANLRFPFKRAKVFSRNDPSSFEELIAAGNEGLIVGMEKFKPAVGVRFLSYAGWWVDQRILKQMSSRIVAVPIWKQQLSARIQKKLDKEPDITLKQLKEAFPEASPRDVEELYGTRYLTFYIEDLEGDPEFEINPIQDSTDLKIDQDKVGKAVSALPSPHREFIQGLFGFMDGGEKRQKELAEELGLSKERIKSVKLEAFEMLRLSLGDHNFLGA